MIYDHTNPKYMSVWLSSPNRFNDPDPSFWKVIDNREAAQMLQEILDVVDG